MRHLLILLALLLPGLGFGAVSFDVASSGSDVGVTSLTWPQTIAPTANFAVAETIVGGAADITTGVTWNGVAMTSAGTAISSTNITTHLWYLANPATGAHSFVASFSSTCSPNGLGMSFFGALGTISGYLTSGSSGTAPSLAVTSAVGDMVVDGLGFSLNSGTATGSQTVRANTNSSASIIAYCSTGPGAATTTMAYTLSGSANYALAAFDIPAAPVTYKSTMALTGAG